MRYGRLTDLQFRKLEKYKRSAVKLDNGARLGLLISLFVSLFVFIVIILFVPMPIKVFISFVSIVPITIGLYNYFRASKYVFGNNEIALRKHFTKSFYPYLSISAITERSGQLRDQDGRYLKTRFIDIIVSEGKETKRLTFECGTKIMLILLAKSGLNLSHLEDAFIDAYLKSVYNKVYDKIEVWGETRQV